MNEQRSLTILNTRPFVGTFSDYGDYVRKGKPKVTYSVALVTAFLAAENENRQLEDLPRADFGRLPERFLSVRTKSINENL